MHLKHHCSITLFGLYELLSVKVLEQSLVHTKYYMFAVVVVVRWCKK